jgi:hypothetical protein
VLIQLFSDRWHSCWHFSPVWEGAHERLGQYVAFFRVNVDVEARVVQNRFDGHISHLPMVVAYYRDGRYEVMDPMLATRNGIQEFVEASFGLDADEAAGYAHPLVAVLDTEQSLEQLGAWAHSRSRVVLVGAQDKPGIFFRHIAYANRGKAFFGFVPASAAQRLSALLGVAAAGPALVTMREPGARGARVVPLKGVPDVKQVIEREVERHGRLAVPKLHAGSSGLCPDQAAAVVVVTTSAAHRDEFAQQQQGTGRTSSLLRAAFDLATAHPAHYSATGAGCVVWVDRAEQASWLDPLELRQPVPLLLALQPRRRGYAVLDAASLASPQALGEALRAAQWAPLRRAAPLAAEHPIEGPSKPLLDRLLDAAQWLYSFVSLPVLLAIVFSVIAFRGVTSEPSPSNPPPPSSGKDVLDVAQLKPELIPHIISTPTVTTILLVFPMGEEALPMKETINACLKHVPRSPRMASFRMVFARHSSIPFERLGLASYAALGADTPRLTALRYAQDGATFFKLAFPPTASFTEQNVTEWLNNLFNGAAAGWEKKKMGES